MKLSMSDFNIQHFAKLSRLKISEEEIPAMQKQMNDILDMVDQLKELDLEGIEGTNFAVATSNITREDIIKPSAPVDDVVKTFPSNEDNHNKVPVMIGDE